MQGTIGLEPGKIHLVLGGNGSGKSTLLRALFHRLASKSEEFAGCAGSRVAFLPQRLLHAQDVSASGLRRLSGDIAFSHWDRVPRSTLGRLSGGQRQRALLYAVFAREPGILLLDEPFRFLDLDAIAEVRQLLAKCLSKAAIVLIAEHPRVTDLSVFPVGQEICPELQDEARNAKSS